MKKQYGIRQEHSNLISYDLIENGKVNRGRYVMPNNDYAKKFMVGYLKRKGYKEK